VTQTAIDQRVPVRPTTGAIVALGIALPAALAPVLVFNLLVIVGGGAMLNNPVELSGWLSLCCLAFSGAASIITSLTNRRALGGQTRIILLAVLTELIGLLLMPVVVSIWSAPGALNGGPMPCLHIDAACQAGLHGLDAIEGLVAASLTWYFVAVVLIPPGVAMLIVPAAIWDRLMAARFASPYHRS
jgi:hypothetical protein